MRCVWLCVARFLLFVAFVVCLFDGRLCHCLLFVVFVVRCLLFVVRCLTFVVRGSSLFVVGCSLYVCAVPFSVVYGLLLVVSLSFFARCLWLFVVCSVCVVHYRCCPRLLFVVCCSLMVC